MHECAQCGESFSDEEALAVHLADDHNWANLSSIDKKRVERFRPDKHPGSGVVDRLAFEVQRSGIGRSVTSVLRSGRINRRRFLIGSGVAAAGGGAAIWYSRSRDRKYKIAITSDGHWGHSEREYETKHEEMLTRMHAEEPDFILHPGDISNGGLGHDGRAAAQELVRDEYLEETGAPYTVAHGNHDSVSDEVWEDIWGVPKNHTWEHGDIGVIVLDSTDDEGYGDEEDGSEELYPNTDFLATALNDFSDKTMVFVVSHYWFSPDLDRRLTGAGGANVFSQNALDLIHDQENVAGVIHGHNHGETAEHAYQLEHRGRTLPYFMGGVFGGTTSTEAEFGYRIINVYDDWTMDSVYKGLDGSEVSSTEL